MTALILLLIVGVGIYAATRNRRPRPGVHATPLLDRVAFLERRVDELTLVLDTLRTGARPVAKPAPPEPEPVVVPPRPEPARPMAPPRPAPAPSRVRSFDWGRTVSAADLLGAKALALTGGVVTLLGVVFFFVLAVNRGWIGPELRVACGGLVSTIVFAAGLWLERRYERTYSALAAVGVGIAGAYATLLAAVSLYDLVSKPVALVAAAVIAATGLTVSLVWSEEIGGGTFGVMVRSNWYVREQIPAPGHTATTVRLVVERCDDD